MAGFYQQVVVCEIVEEGKYNVLISFLLKFRALSKKKALCTRVKNHKNAETQGKTG